MLRTTTRFIGMTGAPYYNQLFFGGSTVGEAQAAADAARLFWGNCANGMSTLLEGQVLPEVVDIDPATGQQIDAFNTTTSIIDGFAAGETLPPANQGLVRFTTSTFVNGRRLRGRVFIPGPTEAMSSGQQPTATYLGYLTDAIDDLITASGPAGDLVIYSRTHLTAGVVTGGTGWGSGWGILRSRRD